MSAATSGATDARPRLARWVAVLALTLVAACATTNDKVAEPQPTETTAVSTEAPAQKPEPTTTNPPPTSTTAETTTSLGTTTGEDADTGATGGGGDGPFGRDAGPGRIAPSPPSGPLVDGSNTTTRAALVVKIDNIAEAWPQAGLNQADVTFEILVEGVSRFAAVFNSENAPLIGPVRSARTSDVDLIPMLGEPCFAFSGGNEGVVQEVDDAPVVNVSAEAKGGAYVRAGDREIPHNLMTSSSALRAACRGGGTPHAIFSYRAGLDRRGREVDGVALRLGASASRFLWDGSAQRWRRFVDEYAQVDTEGVQVSPVNVVVLETSYLPSPADSRSPEAQTLGSGDAWVLIDGLAVAGTWQRSSPTQPYRLSGEDGATIALHPGRTWVVLAPPGSSRLLDRTIADG